MSGTLLFLVLLPVCINSPDLIYKFSRIDLKLRSFSHQSFRETRCFLRHHAFVSFVSLSQTNLQIFRIERANEIVLPATLTTSHPHNSPLPSHSLIFLFPQIKKPVQQQSLTHSQLETKHDFLYDCKGLRFSFFVSLLVFVFCQYEVPSRAFQSFYCFIYLNCVVTNIRIGLCLHIPAARA